MLLRQQTIKALKQAINVDSCRAGLGTCLAWSPGAGVLGWRTSIVGVSCAERGSWSFSAGMSLSHEEVKWRPNSARFTSITRREETPGMAVILKSIIGIVCWQNGDPNACFSDCCEPSNERNPEHMVSALKPSLASVGTHLHRDGRRHAKTGMSQAPPSQLDSRVGNTQHCRRPFNQSQSIQTFYLCHRSV